MRLSAAVSHRPPVKNVSFGLYRALEWPVFQTLAVVLRLFAAIVRICYHLLTGRVALPLPRVNNNQNSLPECGADATDQLLLLIGSEARRRVHQEIIFQWL